MSLKMMLEYCKPERIQTNNVLLEIARKVVNSSPEPRYKIKLRDEVLAMKEKERLGFNFNRSVTASLKSRWDVVEKATVDYLQEILEMNDQIEDDDRKYENQLINLIVTRTTNLGLNSRIEQMAGLFMHMNFYCTVLKFKIQHLEPTRAFMFTCSDLMGFSRPSQLVDRYAALQHVFSELYADYETRQNLLNHLTETLGEVKAETNHRNMLMHNQMADMHTKIKQYQTESAQLERAIQDQMEVSTGASLEIYKIRNAVHNIYMTMMNYRGLEAIHNDSFEQLDELEVRITHTQAAVRMLQMEEVKRQVGKKSRKKSETAEMISGVDEAYSESGSDEESDDNRKVKSENVNTSAADAVSVTGRTSESLGAKRLRTSTTIRNKKRYLGTAKNSNLKHQRTSLPPIYRRDSIVDVNKTENRNTFFPSLDTNSNKAATQRHTSLAQSEPGCLSSNDGGVNLPEIPALNGSAVTRVGDASSIKGASGFRDSAVKLPESVSVVQQRSESCSCESLTVKDPNNINGSVSKSESSPRRAHRRGLAELERVGSLKSKISSNMRN